MSLPVGNTKNFICFRGKKPAETTSLVFLKLGSDLDLNPDSFTSVVFIGTEGSFKSMSVSVSQNDWTEALLASLA